MMFLYAISMLKRNSRRKTLILFWKIVNVRYHVAHLQSRIPIWFMGNGNVRVPVVLDHVGPDAVGELGTGRLRKTQNGVALMYELWSLNLQTQKWARKWAFLAKAWWSLMAFDSISISFSISFLKNDIENENENEPKWAKNATKAYGKSSPMRILLTPGDVFWCKEAHQNQVR